MKKLAWLLAIAPVLVAAVCLEALSNNADRAVTDAPVDRVLSLTPASVAATAATPVGPYPVGAGGYAISWPQCGAALPAKAFDFAIVGVTGGWSFRPNPCLADEYDWARRGKRYVAFYMNTNFDEAAYPAIAARLKTICLDKGEACEAYLYGFLAAEDAYASTREHGATAPMWWLDVQIASTWSGDRTLNALSIRGAIDALRSHDVRVGISSTPFQWREVAGDYAPQLPGWVAGASDAREAATFCDGSQDFGGGHTEQIAYVADGFEMVRACGPATPAIATRRSRGSGD